jgi:nuclear protein localization family protein 4
MLQVFSDFGLASYAFCLFKSRGQKDEIRSSGSKTLKSLGLKHGDMIYLEPLNGETIFDQAAESSFDDLYAKSLPSTSRSFAGNSSSNGTTNAPMNIVFPNNQTVEDEVDQHLWKSDGKIKRQKDTKL